MVVGPGRELDPSSLVEADLCVTSTRLLFQSQAFLVLLSPVALWDGQSASVYRWGIRGSKRSPDLPDVTR